MLVLSRKAGESIIIAGNIRVTIISTDRGAVRVGIMAPPEVDVDREERWLEKRGFSTKGAETGRTKEQE